MTAVRPEHAAGGGAGSPRQPPYGDPGDFAHAVEQLADPLSDPLPGAGVPQDGGWYGQQAQPPHQQQGYAQQQYPQQPQQSYPRQAPPQQQPGYPQAYDPYAAGYPAQAAPQQSPQAPAQAPAPGYAPQSPYEQPQSGYERPGAAYEPGYPAPRPTRPAPRVDATAEMPRLDEPAAPNAPDTPEAEAEQPSAPGGRAERRKAAKRGGRRAADGAAAAGGSPDGGADNLPVSRMDAKRAARAARTSPGVVASQVTGELFITMGVLMLLFVVYQLWYTNVLADEAAGSAASSLQHQWADKKASSDAGEPNSFAPGTPFAMIYIPKLDVKAPIAEGVDKTTILDKGEVGHYDGAQETAMPWAKSGNFALAGHRNTHGEPFRYINKLVAGDKVVVETSGMYYTYQITTMLPQTSPANVSVIEPVPPGSGFTGPGRYITLTTCTPEFTSEFRLIVWGKMVAEQPRTKGTPAALLGG